MEPKKNPQKRIHVTSGDIVRAVNSEKVQSIIPNGHHIFFHVPGKRGIIAAHRMVLEDKAEKSEHEKKFLATLESSGRITPHNDLHGSEDIIRFMAAASKKIHGAEKPHMTIYSESPKNTTLTNACLDAKRRGIIAEYRINALQQLKKYVADSETGHVGTEPIGVEDIELFELQRGLI